MKKTLKILGLSVTMALTGLVASELPFSTVKSDAYAQTPATTMQGLLQKAKKQRALDSAENRKRLSEFRSARNRQASLLQQAKNDVAREEAESERLEAIFNENDRILGELELQLADRLGAFGELFGTARQVAGDTRGQLNNSLVSAQFPGRAEIANAVATTKELPTMDQLRELWSILLQEMIEQGKVVTFDAVVTDTDGKPQNAPVTRVGPFTAVSDGAFLQYKEDEEKDDTWFLAELVRQPGSAWTGAASDLEDADSGELIRAAIDPSSGAILGLLVQTPSIRERIDQGGIVGYIVIVLAAIGVVVGILRTISLWTTAGAVRRQARNRKASKSNPLGRVFLAYEENQGADVETLELKLDDAILKEMPKLEKGLNMLKVLAGVAPLLGLLGTVTGMIQTFQAITLFGTGDPKLMAGGISQALVTTVLGLVAAIPLLLLHSLAAGRARVVQQILEEQSAGLVAAQAEGR